MDRDLSSDPDDPAKLGRRKTDPELSRYFYDVHVLKDWAFGDERGGRIGVAEQLRELARNIKEVSDALKVQKVHDDRIKRRLQHLLYGAIASGLVGPHLGDLWNLAKAHF